MLRNFKPPTTRQRKKIGKYLSSGEEVIFVTPIGNRYFLINTIVLFAIPLLLTYTALFMFLGAFDIEAYPWIKYLGIISLIILILNLKKSSALFRKRQSFTYALTNKRFLIISGIFTRKIVTAPLDRITHITVEQSFPQRYLYNTGHLVIITAGFDQREIVIEHIANPVRFKVLIEELTTKLDKNYTTEDDEERHPKLRAISL